MNKKELVNRWQDAEFAAIATPLAERVLVQKQELKGADLRGLVVGLDGSLAPFLHKDFQGASLEQVDLSFAQFSCSFNHCRMANVTLDEVCFDTCRFKSSHFEKCKFNKARMESPSLDDAEFSDCTFVAAKLHGRGWNEYGGKRIKFTRCRFVGTNFKNLQIRASKFIDCEFTNAVFTKCILSVITFQGSSPSPDSFFDCEVTQCLLNGSAFV